MIVTDNTKTLAEALARIETLETEKAHLLKVIKERKIAGYLYHIGNGRPIFKSSMITGYEGKFNPVYYISDEYDAAGFLITPEVKL